MISCGDNEEIIHVWDEDDENKINLKGHVGGTVSLSVFDDYIVSIGSSEIKVWQLPEENPIFEIPTTEIKHPLTALSTGQDSHLTLIAAVGHKDGSLSLWNLETRALIQS